MYQYVSFFQLAAHSLLYSIYPFKLDIVTIYLLNKSGLKSDKLTVILQQEPTLNTNSSTRTKLSLTNKLIALMLPLLVMTACQKSEIDDLKEAQLCMNKAPVGQASNCLSKISQYTTPQSYELRCSAEFIDQGFGDPSTLLAAINQANNTSCTGCSSSINTISALSFNSTTKAAQNFNNCNLSGISAYSQVSSLVQISTLAKSASATITTADDFKAVIATLPATDVGQIAISTYQYGCNQSENSTGALQQYCTELSSTVVSSDPAVVGTCMIYHLTGVGAYPGLPCPAL